MRSTTFVTVYHSFCLNNRCHLPESAFILVCIGLVTNSNRGLYLILIVQRHIPVIDRSNFLRLPKVLRAEHNYLIYRSISPGIKPFLLATLLLDTASFIAFLTSKPFYETSRPSRWFAVPIIQFRSFSLRQSFEIGK